MDQFKFKDNQRIYFGLEPINKSWDEVKFANGLICYFDKDTIKKIILSETNPVNYIERDTNITTNNRTKLIPKTAKGKEKTITLVNTFSYDSTASFGFHISRDKNKNDIFSFEGSIGQTNLDIKNNALLLTGSKTVADAENNIISFIKALPKNHLDILEQIKNKKKQKTKPVRFKSGDFFAVPVKRNFYGEPTEYIFGRHLLNISELRKKGFVDQLHHWNNLMTVVQLVTLYNYSSDTLIQDLEILRTKDSIPAFYMMDDLLMRGQYPIIGHIPLKSDEINFPMHYGKHLGINKKEFYFGWGLAMIDDIKQITFNNLDTESSFRNSGVHFGANEYILNLFKNGQPPFAIYCDINHPDNLELKEKIFASLNIDYNISYDDFCKKANCMNREELLKITL